MTDLEIMDWLEKKDSAQAYIGCIKRRIAACAKRQDVEFPGLKYLNSPPRKKLECKECARKENKPGEKDYICPAIHAEVKAIMSTFLTVGYYEGIKEKCYDLFVTHFPCRNCALLAIYIGIYKIFYRYDYYNSKEKEGKEAIKYVRFFLEESGVELIKI